MFRKGKTMKLQGEYEKLTDVPADFQSAFAEKDGKVVFVGGDFEFKTEADVEKVLGAKRHIDTELSETKAKLKVFDGIDIEKYNSSLDELDVLRAKVKEGSNEEEIADIVNARVARKTEELTNQAATLQEQIDLLEGFKTKAEKEAVLNDALKNVSKEVHDDARFIIGSVLERQADGSFMTNGTGGFDKGLSAEEAVAKAIESRPHWKKTNTPGHGGSGARGGGVQSKMAKLKELTAKRAKGKLDKASQKEMNTLAAEIKAEQKGL